MVINKKDIVKNGLRFSISFATGGVYGVPLNVLLRSPQPKWLKAIETAMYTAAMYATSMVVTNKVDEWIDEVMDDDEFVVVACGKVPEEDRINEAEEP